MLTIKYQKQFKKDLILAEKRGFDLNELKFVVNLLQNGEPLPNRYKDHRLLNSKLYKNVRECHIKPDWLLIYQVVENDLILNLLRTGTHSDLF